MIAAAESNTDPLADREGKGPLSRTPQPQAANREGGRTGKGEQPITTGSKSAVSSIRRQPEITRETVYSFLWSHMSEGLRGACCAWSKVDPFGCCAMCWDDLEPTERDALRPQLHELLQGHEGRRQEARAGR